MTKTITARLASLKGATVCAAIGHRPQLAESVTLRPWPLEEVRHRGTYCRRCLANIGD